MKDIDVCPACGGWREWIECDAIGCDDGVIPGDVLQDEDPLWYDDDDYEICSQCLGAGGWWYCTCMEARP